MATIQVSDSLLPKVKDKLVDARARIDKLADLESINLPAVGMTVYVKESQRVLVVDAIEGTLTQTVSKYHFLEGDTLKYYSEDEEQATIATREAITLHTEQQDGRSASVGLDATTTEAWIESVNNDSSQARIQLQNGNVSIDADGKVSMASDSGETQIEDVVGAILSKQDALKGYRETVVYDPDIADSVAITIADEMGYSARIDLDEEGVKINGDMGVTIKSAGEEISNDPAGVEISGELNEVYLQTKDGTAYVHLQGNDVNISADGQLDLSNAKVKLSGSITNLSAYLDTLSGGGGAVDITKYITTM